METWKAVVGFEGRYEVSDFGRVRSLDRIVIKRNGRQQPVVGRVLSGCVDGAGYLHVGLSESTGKQRNVNVHRAVAEAFIERKEACKYVDHIDGDKLNNKVSNLRWVTSGQNANFRHVSRSRTGVVGVFYSPKSNASKPYKVEIKMNAKSKFIGYYSTVELATKARKEALADELAKVVQ